MCHGITLKNNSLDVWLLSSKWNNISEGWHMEAAFVDVEVSRNNLDICVSCSERFKHSVMWTICLSSLSLLVLKAGIVQSTQTGQCMFNRTMFQHFSEPLLL